MNATHTNARNAREVAMARNAAARGKRMVIVAGVATVVDARTATQLLAGARRFSPLRERTR